MGSLMGSHPTDGADRASVTSRSAEVVTSGVSERLKAEDLQGGAAMNITLWIAQILLAICALVPLGRWPA